MKFLGAIFLLLLIAAGAVGYLLYAPVTPPAEVFVDLPTGTGSSAMAAKLQDEHIILSRYAFLLLRAWKGGSLKAGEYRFADPASAATVYARIARGDVYTRAVTVPEGYNLYDIAAAVEAAGLGSRAAFLQAAHTNADLVSSFAPTATSLEGYLYPDTYRFSRHTTLRTMQDTMVRRFRKQAAAMGLLTAPDIGRTVILASLVEKEVHFDNERTEAAGVFANRAGPQHAPADRPYGDLCGATGRPLDGRDPPQRPGFRFALQHLSPQRPAARPHLLARRGRPACGNAPRSDRQPLLRGGQHRAHSVLRRPERARRSGGQLPPKPSLASVVSGSCTQLSGGE